MARNLDSVFLGVRADTTRFNRDIDESLRRATSRLKPVDLKLNEKGFRQPLGRINGDISEFNKSMDAASARVFAFSGTVGIISAVTRGFKSLVTQTVEVEASLANINVLLKASSRELNIFGNELFNIAKNTQNSFQNVAQAAQEFSRQGLSMEETLRRTNDALTLTRLSSMDAVKSVEALTAAVNGFARAGITTTEVLDKFASVDAAFAVSSTDLAEALSRAGASAQDANVSFDELLGLVASVQQQTARGGPVIGNAFKSIFTRLQRSSTIDQLRQLGVAIDETQTGTEKLIALADALDSVSSEGVASQIKELAGGVFQINVVSAALNDLRAEYSIFANAVDIANKAQGEAVKRNEELNKTLKALVNETGQSVDQLFSSLGDIGISNNLKALTSSFNEFLNFVNNAIDGEGIGNQIGRNIVAGIGNFLSGPVLVSAFAIIGKLFIQTVQFASKAFKELLGLTKETERQANLQKVITNILQTQNGYYGDLVKRARSQTEQEQIILNVIKGQVAAKRELEAVTQRLASSQTLLPVEVGQSGLRINNNRIPRASSGYGDSFMNALVNEKKDVIKGVGGANAAAKPILIKDFNFGNGVKGPMVANDQEYIIRGKGSTPDSILTRDMVREMGGIKRIQNMGGKPVENAASGRNYPINAPIVQVDKLENAMKSYTDSLIEAQSVLETAYKNYEARINPNKSSGRFGVREDDKFLQSSLEASIINRDKIEQSFEESLRRVNFEKVLENSLVSQGTVGKAVENILLGKESEQEIIINTFRKELPKTIKDISRLERIAESGSSKDADAARKLLNEEYKNINKILKDSSAGAAFSGEFADNKSISKSLSNISEELDRSVSKLRQNLERTVEKLSPERIARLEQRAAGRRLVQDDVQNINQGNILFRRRRLLELQRGIDSRDNISEAEKQGANTLINASLRETTFRRTASRLGDQIGQSFTRNVRAAGRNFMRGGFGASIAASMLSPTLENFRRNEREGTFSGEAAGIAGGALTGLSFGALLGPWGMAIGATTGALWGLNRALDPTNANIAKFGRELEKLTTESAKTINSLTAISQAQSRLSEFIRSGESPEQIDRAQSELIRAVSQIADRDLRLRASRSLSGGVSQLSEITAIEQRAGQDRAQMIEILSRISQLDSDTGIRFGVRIGRTDRDEISSIASDLNDIILSFPKEEQKEIQNLFLSLTENTSGFEEALQRLNFTSEQSKVVIDGFSRNNDLLIFLRELSNRIDISRESSIFAESALKYRASIEAINRTIISNVTDINRLSSLSNLESSGAFELNQLLFENRFAGRSQQNETVSALLNLENTIRRGQNNLLQGISTNSEDLRSSISNFITSNRETIESSLATSLTDLVTSGRTLDPNNILSSLGEQINSLDNKNAQEELRNILLDSSLELAKLVENTEQQNRLAQANVEISRIIAKNAEEDRRRNVFGGPSSIIDRSIQFALLRQENRTGRIQSGGLVGERINDQRASALIRLQSELSSLNFGGERLDVRSFIPDAENIISRSLQNAIREEMGDWLSEDQTSQIVSAQLDGIFKRNELTAQDIADKTALAFGNEVAKNTEVSNISLRAIENISSDIKGFLNNQISQQREERDTSLRKDLETSINQRRTAIENSVRSGIELFFNQLSLGSDDNLLRRNIGSRPSDLQEFLSSTGNFDPVRGTGIPFGRYDARSSSVRREAREQVNSVVIDRIEQLIKENRNTDDIIEILRGEGLFKFFREDSVRRVAENRTSFGEDDVKELSKVIKNIFEDADTSNIRAGMSLEEVLKSFENVAKQWEKTELTRAGIIQSDEKESTLGNLFLKGISSATDLFDQTKVVLNSLIPRIKEFGKVIEEDVLSVSSSSPRSNSFSPDFGIGSGLRNSSVENQIRRLQIDLSEGFTEEAIFDYFSEIEARLNSIGLSLQDNEELSRKFIDNIRAEGISINASDIMPSSVAIAREAQRTASELRRILSDPFSGLAERNTALLEMSKTLNHLKREFGENSEQAIRFAKALKEMGVAVEDLPDTRTLGGFGAGFMAELDEQKRALFDISTIGRNVALELQDGFANAFTNAIRGAESFGDSMKRIFSDVFANISRQFAQMAFNEAFSGIGSIIGNSFGSSFSNIKLFNKGGYASNSVPSLLTGGEYVAPPSMVKKYGLKFFEDLNSGKINSSNTINSNGMVTGGSGVRDDRFANLADGSFVINKASTRRYSSLINKMNKGGVQQRFWGGLIGGITNLFSSNIGTQLLTSGIGAGAGYLMGGGKGALLGAGLGFGAGTLMNNMGSASLIDSTNLTAANGVGASSGMQIGMSEGLAMQSIASANDEQNRSRFLPTILGAAGLAGIAGLLGGNRTSGGSNKKRTSVGSTVTKYSDGRVEVQSSSGTNIYQLEPGQDLSSIDELRGRIPGFSNGGLASTGSISYKDQALNNISKQGFKRPINPHILQGSSTEDTFPALLKNNEFVMNDNAVDTFGLNFLNAINNGDKESALSMIKNFENGGMLSQDLSYNTPSSNSNNYNNIEININLNIDSNGNSTENSSVESNDSQNDNDRWSKLANRIGPMVRNIINDEMRSGGTINKGIKGQRT